MQLLNLDKKTLIDINVNDIHELLLSIWVSKTVTARRLQQRFLKYLHLQQ